MIVAFKTTDYKQQYVVPYEFRRYVEKNVYLCDIDTYFYIIATLGIIHSRFSVYGILH